VLTALGVAPDVAERHVQRFREHDEQLLRDQYLVYDDEAAVIQTSRDARNDLMHLFEADAESDGNRRADQRSAPHHGCGSAGRWPAIARPGCHEVAGQRPAPCGFQQ
jgi:hypothetical protein